MSLLRTSSILARAAALFLGLTLHSQTILSIRPEGDKVQLAWPLLSPGLQLQSANILASPIHWITSTTLVSFVDQQQLATIVPAQEPQFFRLAPAFPCSPETIDHPDGAYADDNCDGIDGTVTASVFVAPWGSDSPANGTSYTNPVRTVAYGITRAVAFSRPYVLIQAGTYDGSLTLTPGVQLIGGYNAAWNRGPRTQPGHTTTLRGGLDPVTGQYLAIRADGLAGTNRLADLVIVAPDAAGQDALGNGRSSFGIVVNNAALRLERVTLQAGRGADGAPGAPGVDASVLAATPVMNGALGGDAGARNVPCDSTTRGLGGIAGVNPDAAGAFGAATGGNGGAGGTQDTDCNLLNFNANARPGQPGSNAAYTSGIAGTGGTLGVPCGVPGPGQPGAVRNGAAGVGAAGYSITSGFWTGKPGTAGGTGSNGGGGGGGGGSGGCDTGTDEFGAGGGGGGAGGTRAISGGTGGGGGGASVCLFAQSASLIHQDLECRRNSGGNGGPGGRGGQGQAGGLGGNGGQANGDAHAGGRGGNGGHGGHAGGGGGGAGGYSVGIAHQNTSLANLGGFSISGGSPGAGGDGGLSAPNAPIADRDGNDGNPGTIGKLLDLFAFNPAGGT